MGWNENYKNITKLINENTISHEINCTDSFVDLLKLYKNNLRITHYSKF